MISNLTSSGPLQHLATAYYSRLAAQVGLCFISLSKEWVICETKLGTRLGRQFGDGFNMARIDPYVEMAIEFMAKEAIEQEEGLNPS